VIHLAHIVSTHSLKGYLWQKSIAGYHYEMEVLDNQGTKVYTEELHDKSFEQAVSEIQSVMQVLTFSDELRIYEEFA
jgi:hypothetical protein